MASLPRILFVLWTTGATGARLVSFEPITAAWAISSGVLQSMLERHRAGYRVPGYVVELARFHLIDSWSGVFFWLSQRFWWRQPTDCEVKVSEKQETWAKVLCDPEVFYVVSMGSSAYVFPYVPADTSSHLFLVLGVFVPPVNWLETSCKYSSDHAWMHRRFNKLHSILILVNANVKAPFIEKTAL
jgi:hypothetical protein